jgi:hypothetical protein
MTSTQIAAPPSYRTLAAHDDELKVGDKVLVRWTSAGYIFAAPATVAKINQKTLRVALDADVTVRSPVGNITYPAGWSIIVPRHSSREWTWNNCALPVGTA